MNIHKETRLKDFWQQGGTLGLIHSRVAEHMALNRFEQITRYIHVSDPMGVSSESVFDKLEPLSEHLRDTMRCHWHLDTHLSVDETIERFIGRSAHIVHIPFKPEPEGYKIWVLANEGFVME